MLTLASHSIWANGFNGRPFSSSHIIPYLPFDQNQSPRYAFDVIGEVFFGHMFGFMEYRHDHASLITSLQQILPVISTVALSPSW